MNPMHAEATSIETYQCRYCHTTFRAKVSTWFDATRVPSIRQWVLNRTVNLVRCPFCGNLRFSETPFFYEDFSNGILIAVFPRISPDRDSVEKQIREQYGHYPILDFFYDMTQLWMLVFIQEYYRSDPGIDVFAPTGGTDHRIRRIVRFVKTHPLMIGIRDSLDEITSAAAPVIPSDNERLARLLRQAVRALESLYPWPRDRRCLCGGKLPGRTASGPYRQASGQAESLSPSATFWKTCSEVVCKRCGKVYSDLPGTVESYHGRITAASFRRSQELETPNLAFWQ